MISAGILSLDFWKLDYHSDVAREIVTDGFVLTDTNATVYDSLVTLTYTAP